STRRRTRSTSCAGTIPARRRTSRTTGSASSPKVTRSRSRAEPAELMPRDADTEAAATDPAVLASAVLTEEARRQAEQAERSAVTILPDDLLPGVGEAQMSMRATLNAGGSAM